MDRKSALTALKAHQGPGGKWVADQPPQFDFTSPAYRKWAHSYGDNEWIQTTVYVPSNEQWPNVS
jgi:hypothetical protein